MSNTFSTPADIQRHLDSLGLFHMDMGLGRMSYAEVEKKGLILPVREAQCRYRSSARYDDLVLVRAGIAEWARASLRFVYEILNEDKTRLLATGMELLDCNWRSGRLELDIVCRDGDTVVFVEVKTRSGSTYGGPAAALTPAKQRTLCRAARAWLAAHDAWHRHRR